MIPELGQLCLVLAFLMSLLQAGVPLLNRLTQPYSMLHLVKPTATAVMLLVTAAFGALIYSHAVDDFTVLTVVENSHSTKPMLYKIVGSWGNHEGSMLLWMWVLAACGFIVALLRAHDKELKAVTLAVLGLKSPTRAQVEDEMLRQFGILSAVLPDNGDREALLQQAIQRAAEEFESDH